MLRLSIPSPGLNRLKMKLPPQRLRLLAGPLSLTLLAVFLLPSAALAAINGKCTEIVGSELDTSSGICVTRATCNKYGGDSSWVGYCPYDGKDVRCCFVDNCDNDKGFCGWTSDCSREGGSISRSMSESQVS